MALAEIRRRRITLAAFCTLTLVVAVAYARTFSVPFLLDDTFNIQSNLTLRSLWPLSRVLSPPPQAGVGGRPLLNLSFALSYALGRGQVWAYHAGNALVHLAAALTLFGIVRRTLERSCFGPRTSQDAGSLALITAALWAAHPVQTEAVTYISERAESLMGFFYLLTLYGLIRSDAARRRDRWAWRVVAFAACALGMATKEVMATAPAVAVLYDAVFLSGSWRKTWQRNGGLHVALIATWGLLAWLMRDVGLREVGFGGAVSAWTYALTECPVLLRYLELAFWPANLVFYHSPHFASRLASVLPAAVSVLVLLTGSALLLVRRPRAGFCATAFFILLAPTSSFVPILNQPMAEHRLYLPLAALAAGCVVGVHALVGRRVRFASAAMCVALVGLTWARNRDYRSELAIWRDNVAKDPGNSAALNNVAMADLHLGRDADALPYCRAALRADPKNEKAYNNLGCALSDLGHNDQAIRCFKRALAIRSTFADAWANLGATYAAQGRYRDSLAPLIQAARLDPQDATAENDLGNSLIRLGRPAIAVPWFDRALGLDPTMAKAWNNLGAACEALHRPGAIDDYRTAVRLEPGARAYLANLGAALERANRWPEALIAFKTLTARFQLTAVAAYDFALALDHNGRRADAVAWYRRALGIDPNLAEAHTNLGQDLLARPGGQAEAVAQFRWVVRLRPRSAMAYRNLAAALYATGDAKAAADELRIAESLK